MEYTCSTCRETKDEKMFGVCATYASGRNPRCKQCCNAAAKRYRKPSLLERIIALEQQLSELRRA